MSFRDRIREFTRVPASTLRPSPRNWRTHPAEQRTALRAVLEEVGYVDALLVRPLPDGTLEIVDGHLRQEESGDMPVPVLICDLDDAEAATVLATFDPLSAMAGADAATLNTLLAGIETDNDVLKKLLDKVSLDAGLFTPPEVKQDEVPELPATAITKPGDLWVLGEHRLLCGDSTKAEDVGRLFDGQRAGLLFTSPPYAQQRDYGAAKEHVADWDRLMCGVFAHAGQYMEDDGQILVNLGLVHRDGEWVPYWDGWISWMREQGWRRFGWYVWDQGWGLPGDFCGRFPPSHEFIFHFNVSAIRPWKTVRKKEASVVKDATKGRSVGMRRKDGKTNKLGSPKSLANHFKHPAIFPVALPSQFIACWPGLVYEPFSGSGTTIIAAEQLGRRCYAIELDPLYCDVAVRRWENLTGRKAELTNG
jgi:DNA modification methylase